jgi:hypothetical protein
MPVPDFFNSSAFNAVSLTIGINKIPNKYGRLQSMGLFNESGVTTRTVVVEERNGVLNLLPTQPVGSPGTVGTEGRRKVRSFVVPHIPHDDVVLPEEVQNLRAFGSENALESVSSMMAQKMATMRAKHDITLEFMRMGALKGIVIDGGGVTLWNLYTEFGITAKEINFALTTSSTEVLSKVLEGKRHIEDNLKGEMMTGVHCLCSSGFYDALTTHATVKEAYKYYMQRQNVSGDFRSGFEYGGVVFEEYRGTSTSPDGTARPFITANEAHMFPVGTTQTFQTYFAPADFNEAANTPGLAVYAKQEPRKFGRGWDLHTQSNPLPLCLRPELLVKCTKS